ncbi:hypothetical protein K491DRAFT_298990 [Lophiostoma macrostomum CBS 122681]|uniref:Uncharacterized protein n=1 Tax=Lophiostoma macrostomum CBS 122681 TaxID=1314788 RepID=A0A6A6SLQ5_9PLEO|nr:hypothetical protein K491DRAFT_298990 [Lophiostoma macrostomum CBS 122681]
MAAIEARRVKSPEDCQSQPAPSPLLLHSDGLTVKAAPSLLSLCVLQSSWALPLHFSSLSFFLSFTASPVLLRTIPHCPIQHSS